MDPRGPIEKGRTEIHLTAPKSPTGAKLPGTYQGHPIVHEPHEKEIFKYPHEHSRMLYDKATEELHNHGVVTSQHHEEYNLKTMREEHKNVVTILKHWKGLVAS